MQVSLGRNDYLTLAGGLFTIVGAFAPFLEIARLGTVSYAKVADPQVYLLIACAVAAGALVLAGKKAFSLYAALGAWLVLLWPVIKNMGGGSDDGGLLGKVRDAAADPLQKVAGKLFSNVFGLEWGGYLFLIGMMLLLAGGILAFLAARKA